MKKIILTLGCPGSGKSTWATQYIKDNVGFYDINRDTIRVGMLGLENRNEYRYSKAREQNVTNIQLAMADALLQADTTKGVIVSDTNLKPARHKLWAALADKHNAQLHLEVFDVPWTTLVQRNVHRGDKAVPIDVLRQMYYNLREYQEKPVYDPGHYDADRPKAIIFDLDGTYALNHQRSPYDLEKLSTDAPNKMVILLAQMFKAQGYKIITVSGRESGTKDEPKKYYDSTIDWMHKHGAPTDEHFQRQQGDTRKDDVVKEQIFWYNIAHKYNVKLAVDDRDQVVEMWRRIGIECWQVNFGEF